MHIGNASYCQKLFSGSEKMLTTEFRRKRKGGKAFLETEPNTGVRGGGPETHTRGGRVSRGVSQQDPPPSTSRMSPWLGLNGT